MAKVYEIDGRLLIRTVNNCGGAGIEDGSTVVVDGYPTIAPDELGQTVQAALDRCRDVPMPSSWPPMRDYARPFLELSPRRYRSYRAWQRATRSVFVQANADSVRVQRQFPELGRGAWRPAATQADDTWTYEVVVTADAGTAALGSAVLKVLEAPPLQETPG